MKNWLVLHYWVKKNNRIILEWVEVIKRGDISSVDQIVSTIFLFIAAT